MSVYTVTNTNSSGAGSLAKAVADAEAHGGPDTITFAAGLSGSTIRLATTLALTQDLTIDGDLNNDGVADITISGDRTGNGASSDDVRIFSIYSTFTVTLDGVRLQGGFEIGQSILYQIGDVAASAILNAGTLHMTNSVLSNNFAVGGDGFSQIINPQAGYNGGSAGTIVNDGTLTLSNVTFSNNTAVGGAGGTGGYGEPAGNDFGLPAGQGHSGGSGGDAASAILHLGASLSLDDVRIGTGDATGGDGGTGGAGGTGYDFFPGFLYSGGTGGGGGHGGYAGAIVAVASNVSGNVNFTTTPALHLGDGGAAGPGGAANGGPSAGNNGTDGADGQTGELMLLSGATSTLTTVTNTNDDGAGSLRYVLAHAQAGDTITFSSHLDGKIIFLQSTLAITQDITIDGDIDGDGKADITISGDKNEDSNTNSGDVRILNVFGTTSLRLESVWLNGGYSNTGGAIYSGSTTSSITLLNTSVTGSKATSGGGIYTKGNLTAVSTSFYNNEATSVGGAVFVGQTGRLINTTMVDNQAMFGGAIMMGNGGHLYLNGSTISHNNVVTGGNGGALYLADNATATVRNSVLSSNYKSGVPSNTDFVGGSNVTLNVAYSFVGSTINGSNATLGAGVQTGTNPMLASRADNGGPVVTMAPLAGSPLIGAGSNLIASVGADVADVDHDGNTTEIMPFDARGFTRIVGKVDIGAFESPKHAPVGVNDDNASDAVEEATSTSVGHLHAAGNVLSNDTDSDIGDTRTVDGFRTGTELAGGNFGAVGTLKGTYGSLTLNADGTYSYTIDNTDPDTDHLTTGGTGHDYFTYRVKDGNGLTDIAQLDIRISGANDAPTAVNDTLIAVEDETQVFHWAGLVSNDKDPELLDGPIVSVASGLNGTAVLNSDGDVIFTPDANFNGDATFTYIFADGGGLQSNAATVTIDVRPTNDAPVLTGGSSFTTSENGTAVGTAAFGDIDGDALTYFVNGGADADMFQIDVHTGVLTFVAPHDREKPNDADANGVYEVIIRAYDGHEFLDQAFEVAVTNVVGRTITGNKTKADKIDLTHGPAGKFATNEEDIINGRGGNDTINAGDGNDTVKGGKGVDVLDGQGGTRDLADFSDMTKSVVLTLKGNKVATATVGGVAGDKVKNFESVLGGKAGDKLTGDLKANLIAGLAGNDVLDGGKGNDTLAGGTGADKLTGGKGSDWFIFDTKLGATNVDTLTDFKPGDDAFVLDSGIFAGLGGTVTHDQFYAKAGATKAHDNNDRIIYNLTTGDLYYDADGKKGHDKPILFAHLDNKPQFFDEGDFFIL